MHDYSLRGTKGSNPAPSSGESSANLSFGGESVGAPASPRPEQLNAHRRRWALEPAGPEQVLAYVAGYTHRVAISNDRLIGIDDGKVRFRWKDYRNGNRPKTMALTANEFIRRFLLHVLPAGFQRIRYYGFLGNRCREQKLARCRQLLAMPQPEPSACDPAVDYRGRYEEITGGSLTECPACHHGHMLVIEVVKAIKPCPSIHDTS